MENLLLLKPVVLALALVRYRVGRSCCLVGYYSFCIELSRLGINGVKYTLLSSEIYMQGDEVLLNTFARTSNTDTRYEELSCFVYLSSIMIMSLHDIVQTPLTIRDLVLHYEHCP